MHPGFGPLERNVDSDSPFFSNDGFVLFKKKTKKKHVPCPEVFFLEKKSPGKNGEGTPRRMGACCVEGVPWKSFFSLVLRESNRNTICRGVPILICTQMGFRLLLVSETDERVSSLATTV